MHRGVCFALVCVYFGLAGFIWRAMEITGNVIVGRAREEAEQSIHVSVSEGREKTERKRRREREAGEGGGGAGGAKPILCNVFRTTSFIAGQTPCITVYALSKLFLMCAAERHKRP